MPRLNNKASKRRPKKSLVAGPIFRRFFLLGSNTTSVMSNTNSIFANTCYPRGPSITNRTWSLRLQYLLLEPKCLETKGARWTGTTSNERWHLIYMAGKWINTKQSATLFHTSCTECTSSKPRTITATSISSRSAPKSTERYKYRIKTK